MKSLERFLVPMIMVGILALPSFASQDPSPAPISQQSENIPVDKAIVYVYHSGGSNYPFMLRANGRNIA